MRFEKGQEHRMARLGADRTASLIQHWSGGRVAVGVVDTGPHEPPQARVAFRPARVDRLLGEKIPVDEQRALLERVEIATEEAATTVHVPVIAGSEPLEITPSTVGDAIVAVIPEHRRDLAIEADIIEEIARVRGYETLVGQLPDTPMPPYREDPLRMHDGMRASLAGAGLSELITHGLIGPEDHARLGFVPGDQSIIRASNPVTLDHSELRRSMIPEHLRVLVENERQRRPDIQAFEIGALHEWQDGEPVEREVLGLLLAGREHPVSHDRAATSVDVASAKGLLEQLASSLIWCRLVYEAVTPRDGVEHPGRTAAVIAVSDDGSSTPVGRVGELHPRLLEHYGVRSEHVVFAEIHIDAFERLIPARLRVGPLEHLPGMERDIAVVVAADRASGEVEALIREQGGPHLRSVVLFDRYRGAPLAETEKSLAYRLRFESVDDALDDAAVEKAVERVVAVLSERLGAHLRA